MADLFDDPTAWGASIKEARERARLNLSTLAEELGTTRQRLGRIEGGVEPKKKTRNRNERRAISLAVAEFTDHRDVLGLSAPEPSAVDQLAKELREEMRAQRLALLKEIEQVRRAQASPASSEEPAEEG